MLAIQVSDPPNPLHRRLVTDATSDGVDGIRRVDHDTPVEQNAHDFGYPPGLGIPGVDFKHVTHPVYITGHG